MCRGYLCEMRIAFACDCLIYLHVKFSLPAIYELFYAIDSRVMYPSIKLSNKENIA